MNTISEMQVKQVISELVKFNDDDIKSDKIEELLSKCSMPTTVGGKGRPRRKLTRGGVETRRQKVERLKKEMTEQLEKGELEEELKEEVKGMVTEDLKETLTGLLCNNDSVSDAVKSTSSEELSQMQKEVFPLLRLNKDLINEVARNIANTTDDVDVAMMSGLNLILASKELNGMINKSLLNPVIYFNVLARNIDRMLYYTIYLTRDLPYRELALYFAIKNKEKETFEVHKIIIQLERKNNDGGWNWENINNLAIYYQSNSGEPLRKGTIELGDFTYHIKNVEGFGDQIIKLTELSSYQDGQLYFLTMTMPHTQLTNTDHDYFSKTILDILSKQNPTPKILLTYSEAKNNLRQLENDEYKEREYIAYSTDAIEGIIKDIYSLVSLVRNRKRRKVTLEEIKDKIKLFYNGFKDFRVKVTNPFDSIQSNQDLVKVILDKYVDVQKKHKNLDLSNQLNELQAIYEKNDINNNDISAWKELKTILNKLVKILYYRGQYNTDYNNLWSKGLILQRAYAAARDELARYIFQNIDSIVKKLNNQPQSGGKNKSIYAKTSQKHTDAKGIQRVIYVKTKDGKKYIRKLSKKTGKYTYRGIST